MLKVSKRTSVATKPSARTTAAAAPPSSRRNSTHGGPIFLPQLHLVWRLDALGELVGGVEPPVTPEVSARSSASPPPLHLWR